MNTPDLISSKEASILANVSLKTIRDWRSKNFFQWQKEGDKIRGKIHIDRKSFLEFLSNKNTTSKKHFHGSTIQSTKQVPSSSMVVPSNYMVVPSKVPYQTEVALLKQKLENTEEKLEREQSHNQNLQMELKRRDKIIQQREEEIRELRLKLEQKETKVIAHIGQVASLTSQVGILTNQVEALQQFQEAYNQRVNMGVFQRLFQSPKAIDITVNLTQPSTNLLTDDGIIDPL